MLGIHCHWVRGQSLYRATPVTRNLSFLGLVKRIASFILLVGQTKSTDGLFEPESRDSSTLESYKYARIFLRNWIRCISTIAGSAHKPCLSFVVVGAEVKAFHVVLQWSPEVHVDFINSARLQELVQTEGQELPCRVIRGRRKRPLAATWFAKVNVTNVQHIAVHDDLICRSPTLNFYFNIPGKIKWIGISTEHVRLNF